MPDKLYGKMKINTFQKEVFTNIISFMDKTFKQKQKWINTIINYQNS